MGYEPIKRAVYYASRLISAQKHQIFEHEDYDKIRKVYSIWIQMDVPKERRNTVIRYRIAEDSIFGDYRDAKRYYDLMTVVMVGMGDPNDEKAKEYPILRMMDVLFSDIMSEQEKKRILGGEFGVPMTEVVDTEVVNTLR